MKKKYLTNNEKEGFQVPEHYFEEFGARIFSKLKAEQREPTGILEERKTASGFEVPQNYFETFEVKPQTSAPKVIPLFRKKQWFYAASIAAIFALVFTVFNHYSVPATSFSNLDHSLIETYIENDNIDFSHSEMEYFLSEDADLPNLESSAIDEKILFDYLINSSRELSLINQ